MIGGSPEAADVGRGNTNSGVVVQRLKRFCFYGAKNCRVYRKVRSARLLNILHLTRSVARGLDRQGWMITKSWMSDFLAMQIFLVILIFELKMVKLVYVKPEVQRTFSKIRTLSQ